MVSPLRPGRVAHVSVEPLAPAASERKTRIQSAERHTAEIYDALAADDVAPIEWLQSMEERWLALSKGEQALTKQLSTAKDGQKVRVSVPEGFDEKNLTGTGDAALTLKAEGGDLTLPYARLAPHTWIGAK